MTLLCPKRDGLGHWWLCPAPDRRVVEVKCRECGATKLNVTSAVDRWGKFVAERNEKKQYRQGDLRLDGSEMWAEARRNE